MKLFPKKEKKKEESKLLKRMDTIDKRIEDMNKKIDEALKLSKGCKRLTSLGN